MRDSSLQQYVTMQIAQDVREIKEVQRVQADHLDEVQSSLQELTSWAQRLALLAVLWGFAVGLNIAPEKLAELVGMLLKSTK
ncbi:hypothetical protein UFOVP1157_53 [uncultured Caudovirales phage]|uniref:Uncharacterized protein n=1 Tax=uncultured Caudovirales phage TaxID=2100421 RepID=A0A6J5MKK8_9CAUD|nr:hypothetical protein UFOVP497_42 [uncultured Caudovirales phage]CAB4164326.1 hypothetical protein UFOVP834_18 [uncultured Caudovirales phage]CAB4172396.1 hypothetical protein UFOVP922_53 [uncultured Caudovirales phage]CAB4177754.1 hypothetical protein UFOVP1006_46 [uncultured Caudovirales phage]CAB4184020.1 hypothetical protein UFOVP1096_34 [uncultured Caudovirales phage]